MRKINKIWIFFSLIIIVFSISVVGIRKHEEQSNQQTVATSSIVDTLSTKKIEWGIKRNDNHKQPDLGSKNKSILDNYQGISMGNSESKKVYLTFDEGYEAGYTPKILETLKQNEVKATFFITAHYVNTQPELVQRMIEEGHTIGNHIPVKPMYLKEKSYES